MANMYARCEEIFCIVKAKGGEIITIQQIHDLLSDDCMASTRTILRDVWRIYEANYLIDIMRGNGGGVKYIGRK